MRDILFLAHRIPYPPNKGDKIRSYHILCHLCENYRVHLGAFVDDTQDWEYQSALEKRCASVCLLPLRPFWAKLRSLSGLFDGSPLTVPYYANRDMAAWVRQILAAHNIECAFVFSSAMGQYLQHPGVPRIPRRIMDFVDVDSDKWLQYAKNKPWPANWIYRREAEYLLRYDRTIAKEFDFSLFVTEQEADLFRKLSPELSDKAGVLENGVDTEYFRINDDLENPYPARTEILVFTGAMDYWANVDAVRWFAEEVFPLMYKEHPSVRFYIVGARPTEEVRKLAAVEGITVTGGVADIRPYLQYAHISVAPLRIARGIQNKVLEAMSMSKPVVASSFALEGLRYTPDLDIWQADGVGEWLESLKQMLAQDSSPRFSETNRRFAEAEYSWNHCYRMLDSILIS